MGSTSLLYDQIGSFVLFAFCPGCLLLSEQLCLLDSVGHHLLLLEPLTDIVAIQAQIALLAETEQDLRAEAATNDRCHGQNHYQVRPILEPLGER